MTAVHDNRFEDFFAEPAYVDLKNHLYNYLLRKRAVNRCLPGLEPGRILEVGSGLSPMVTHSERVVYSELSFRALRVLRTIQPRGLFVVADATRLPFKPDLFATVICSEVLEHLPDDREALRQIAAVMKPGGRLILTFPHRRGYFAADDHFVNHFRRYDLSEMNAHLQSVGLYCVKIQKVLGAVEKMIMISVVKIISFGTPFRKGKKVKQGQNETGPIRNLLFKWLNRLLCLPMWVDAMVTPRCLSAVLLIQAEKPAEAKGVEETI
jgi:SAM-dependent methyltransferase